MGVGILYADKKRAKSWATSDRVQFPSLVQYIDKAPNITIPLNEKKNNYRYSLSIDEDFDNLIDDLDISDEDFNAWMWEINNLPTEEKPKRVLSRRREIDFRDKNILSKHWISSINRWL